MHMTTYICVFLGSAYLALATTPLVIYLSRRIGAVDYPGIRSVHTQPIPRIGGVAIYLSTMCLLVFPLFLDNTIGERFREARAQMIVFFATATAVFAIGLIDDLRGLPARFKFTIEALGAGALYLAGVTIDYIDLGEGPGLTLGWLSLPVTVLWIVGVTNAVNMSDGLDGLAAGVSAIACGVIAIFAIHSSTVHTGAIRDNDVMMALFALTLLGSLVGFLFFNFNPAKVFMGDCGSLFIGFTIAAASVMCVSKSAALVGLALPALALGIPIFDTLFSMLRRFLERRSLFAPDRSHFHHRLVAMGLTHRHAVLAIYAATLMGAGLGLLMMASGNAISLAILAAAVLLIVLMFRIVGAVHLQETIARLREKYSYACQQRDERKVFENLQLQFRHAGDAAQWRAAVWEAAQKMDFAWVALQTRYADGRVEEERWPSPEGGSDLSQLMTISVPLTRRNSEYSQQIEVGVRLNGSIEAAGRRASLFGRLLDEQVLHPGA